MSTVSFFGGFDGWRGDLYRLAVHPQYRRRGVAAVLVNQIEDHFVQQGVKRITALVEKNHDDAVALI
ncbi:MAG: GNAT family N-acetyltransferase [Cyanobacteria bacterium P01_A01_bin.135]